MQRYETKIYGLDAYERNDDAAYAVDEQVIAQQDVSGFGLILDAFEGQWDERDDDDRIEDDRGQDGRLRRVEAHDVERAEHRKYAKEHGGDDSEVFGHVVGD